MWRKRCDHLKLYSLGIPNIAKSQGTLEWVCNVAAVHFQLAPTYRDSSSMNHVCAFSPVSIGQKPPPPPQYGHRYKLRESCHHKVIDATEVCATCSLYLPALLIRNQISHFHFTTDWYWFSLTLWLGGSERLQLMMGTPVCMVNWCPMIFLCQVPETWQVIL